MATSDKAKTAVDAPPQDERRLSSLAREGDRAAYQILFEQQLPTLEKFIRREIRFYEQSGALETGLIDPCAVVDQTYLAGLDNLKRMSKAPSFRGWLRFLALHIIRQQARVEQQEEPIGPALEKTLPQADDIDTELWEFYQPDAVENVEDVLPDPRATDPEILLELRESADELERKINTLPSEQREVLILRAVEGLSVDEIAALKHKPPVLIRQTLHDARKALELGK